MEKGVGLVVRRAGVPVIPVVIHGSFEAWPKSKKLFHPHPIRLLYGPPIDFRKAKGEEIVRTIDRRLRELFSEVKERSAQVTR